MAKKYFYVPVVLVVKGNDNADADVMAERIMDGLCALDVRGFDGYTLLNPSQTTLASKDWTDIEQYMVASDVPNRFYVKEGEPS